MIDLTPNHPAVEAARRALANDETNGCMIEQHEGNGMWTCFAHGVSADGPEMCWYVRDMPPIVLNAASEHYTADDLRDTPAGRELMAEGWEKGVLSGAEPILESDGSMVIGLTLPNPYCQGGADDTATPECECPEAPEHLWTTHYGAVDPVTMIEHNPECPVHRIDPQDSRLPSPWARALNNPDTAKGA